MSATVGESTEATFNAVDRVEEIRAPTRVDPTEKPKLDRNDDEMQPINPKMDTNFIL